MARRAGDELGEAMCSVFAGLASIYPAVVRAGVGYWADTAANASSYYADVIEAMIASWRYGGPGERMAVRLLDRFTSYLERSGDNVERGLLELNQALLSMRRPTPVLRADRRGERVVAALRDLADLAIDEAWTRQQAQRRPDALSRRLESLLAEVRALESEAAPK